MLKLFKKALRKEIVIILFILFALTCLYLVPLFKGRVLLPLDLLVSNFNPWNLQSQILVKNPYMEDSVTQMYPWRHLVFQSFQQKIIPFWNPYQLMGMPFMAGMKSMVFYPFGLLYILGEKVAWNALLFFQIFLSMFFTYLLLREFKVNPVSSMLGSLGVSLNSFMIGLLEFGSEGHVLLWLPLLLFLSKKYLDDKKSIFLFFIPFVVSFSIFAGQLQYFGYSLLLVVFFILCYSKIVHASKKVFFSVFISLLLGIGISGIQLIPSVELFANSYRGLSNTHAIFNKGLLEIFQLVRLFSADIFGNPTTKNISIGYIETSGYFGVIPLFFCLYAIFFIKDNFAVKFLKTVFVATILLSLKGTGEILYLLRVPLLTSGSGDRIFSIVLFVGSLLSAFGLYAYSASKNTKRAVWFLVAFAIIYIAIMVSMGAPKLHNDELKLFIKNVGFSFLITMSFFILIFFYLKRIRKNKLTEKIFLYSIIALTFIDFFHFGQTFLTFAYKRFFYPDSALIRFVKKESKSNLAREYGLTQPDISTFLNVYSIETYNPLYIKRSAYLLQALQKQPLNDLPVNTYLVKRGKYLKKAFDFLGVSLVPIFKGLNPAIEYYQSVKYQGDFVPLYQDETYTVYRNKTAYPRFGLFYSAVTIKNDNEILQKISGDSFDFKKQVILEEPLPLNLTQGNGNAKLTASSVNMETFFVKTDKPALFYISDTYFPGWTAKINRVESKIYRANYNFKAVLLPKGNSILEFSYLPRNLFEGITVTIISILLILPLSIFNEKYNYYKGSRNHSDTSDSRPGKK